MPLPGLFFAKPSKEQLLGLTMWTPHPNQDDHCEGNSSTSGTGDGNRNGNGNGRFQYNAGGGKGKRSDVDLEPLLPSVN